MQPIKYNRYPKKNICNHQRYGDDASVVFILGVLWFDLPSSVFLHEFTGPLEAVVKYDCGNENTSSTLNTAITEMKIRKNMFVVIRKFHHRNPNCHQKSSFPSILKRQILLLSSTSPTIFIFYNGINYNAISFDFQFDHITFWDLFGYCLIKLG